MPVEPIGPVVVGVDGSPASLAAVDLAAEEAENGGRVTLPRPVLVGVEGESDAEPLLDFAFAAASMRGAPLLAMHVWTAPDDAPPTGNHHDVAQGHGEALALLNDAVARWADKYPDVPVHTAARRSLDVPIALTATARSAQLVVVGSTGYVARVLMHRAGCPVAVVPVS
jgi:nucleotide-binding universal stress UspA family protein